MKSRSIMTDEEILAEVERLTHSEAVRLARKEQKLIYRARQYLYTLRNLEKRGNELLANGITKDNIEEMLFGEVEET